MNSLFLVIIANLIYLKKSTNLLKTIGKANQVGPLENYCHILKGTFYPYYQPSKQY